MIIYDFPFTMMRRPFMLGCPLLQARRMIWVLSRSAFGIPPKSNLSSSPTSIILKPLDTMNAENCQSFSNMPFESIMTERSSLGWYAVILK